MTRRERVIAAMVEARDAHQSWVDQLRAGEPWYVEGRKHGGTVKHHQRWVRIYNDVLRELGAGI